MTGLMQYAVVRGEQLVDEVAAVLSATWPRSMAAREVARLIEDGHESGTMREVGFSLSFEDEATAASALPVIRAAGFIVDADAARAKGFLVARCPVMLKAYDLARTLFRLNRAIAPFGGFAAMIGPTANGVHAAAADVSLATNPFRAAS